MKSTDSRVEFNFDVFERLKDRVGGRVASITMNVKEELLEHAPGQKKRKPIKTDGGALDGKPVAKFEAGASIAIEGNRYVRDFAENVREYSPSTTSFSLAQKALLLLMFLRA